MIDFLARFIFISGADTFFMVAIILILSFGEIHIKAKEILTILILNSISYYLQTFGFLYVFIDMLFYYLIFILFYKHIKLRTILLSFIILISITMLTYSPIILAWDLNTSLIYNNTILLFIIRIPLLTIEILILILIRRKINENRKISNKNR